MPEGYEDNVSTSTAFANTSAGAALCLKRRWGKQAVLTTDVTAALDRTKLSDCRASQNSLPWQNKQVRKIHRIFCRSFLMNLHCYIVAKRVSECSVNSQEWSLIWAVLKFMKAFIIEETTLALLSKGQKDESLHYHGITFTWQMMHHDIYCF